MLWLLIYIITIYTDTYVYIHVYIACVLRLKLLGSQGSAEKRMLGTGDWGQNLNGIGIGRYT